MIPTSCSLSFTRAMVHTCTLAHNAHNKCNTKWGGGVVLFNGEQLRNIPSVDFGLTLKVTCVHVEHLHTSADVDTHTERKENGGLSCGLESMLSVMYSSNMFHPQHRKTGREARVEERAQTGFLEMFPTGEFCPS